MQTKAPNYYNGLKPEELCLVRSVYGGLHYVAAYQLAQEKRPALRTFNRDGFPTNTDNGKKCGSIHRDNIAKIYPSTSEQ